MHNYTVPCRKSRAIHFHPGVSDINSGHRFALGISPSKTDRPATLIPPILTANADENRHQ